MLGPELMPFNFFFSSINMFVVLDMDEWGASSPVCDINASCSNTRGSYICTCKSGYTGDGKMCQGIINVVLPCDNNGDGRFPGTFDDQQKSAIHRIHSVYIPAVHDIICLGLYLRDNYERSMKNVEKFWRGTPLRKFRLFSTGIEQSWIFSLLLFHFILFARSLR